MTQPIPELRISIRPEGSQLVVQCLNYDLAAQGPGLSEALLAFGCTLEARIELDARAGRAPLSTCAPAPEYANRDTESR